MSSLATLRALGRACIAVTAVTAVGLSVAAPVQALPARTAEGPAARGAVGNCSVTYWGVDTTTGHGTDRVVDDGVWQEDRVWSQTYPKDTVGRGLIYMGFTDRIREEWYHVQRADGAVRVHKFKTRLSDGSLKSHTVVPGTTNDLRSRVFTSMNGWDVFAGVDNGSLFRYTTFVDKRGRYHYDAKTRLLGKSAPTLDSLTYLMTLKIGGVKKHVLLGTTRDGALVRVTVPVKNPSGTRLSVVEGSGYDGVTEISWGICASSATRIPLVTSGTESDTATWSEIPNIKKNLRATTPTVIADTVGWGVFDGVL